MTPIPMRTAKQVILVRCRVRGLIDPRQFAAAHATYACSSANDATCNSNTGAAKAAWTQSQLYLKQSNFAVVKACANALNPKRE